MSDENDYKIKVPKRTIDFQVDTLKTAEFAAAYMTPGNNSITVNYVEGEDNTFNESKATKAHEQKHRDNYNAGMGSMPVSLEEYYKIKQHDEISANMAELLQIRQEYIEAKTDAEREAIVNAVPAQKFSYYFDAVKEGKINPFATHSAEFEKEMKFIATETQKMWMKEYAGMYDSDSTVSATRWWFGSHNYDELKSNSENYEKARKIAYTIGGIDFSKYMEDIELFNEHVRQADKLIAKDAPRDKVKDVLVPKEHPSALTSFEQHAKLSALQSVSDDLRIAMDVRNQWLNCKTEEERQALTKNVVESGVSFMATGWLNAANSGKIEPMKGPLISKEEEEFIGGLISRDTTAVCRGDVAYLKEYEKQKGRTEIQKAIQSGEADKNYANAKKNLFKVGGVDFSSYVKEPIMGNANIALADKKLKNNENFVLDDVLRPFDNEKDLIVPEFKPIEGLSMAQQLQVAQHQMYIENVKARNPTLQVFMKRKNKNSRYEWNMETTIVDRLKQEDAVRKTTVVSGENKGLSPYLTRVEDNSAQFLTQPWKRPQDDDVVITQCSFEQFQADLKNNPELKKKWEEASKQYEKQIAEAHKEVVFLPTDNDKAYQKELDKVYTINGVNLKKTYLSVPKNKGKIESSMPQVQTTEIKKVEESSMVDRAKAKAKTMYHDTTKWVEEKTEKAKKMASGAWKTVTNLFKSEDDKPKEQAKKQQAKTQKAKSASAATRGTQAKSYRNKEFTAEYYTGAPKYAEWSPDKRVSSVQHTQIYDFTSPYLKQQQEMLAKKEAEEKAKKEALDVKKRHTTQRFDSKVDKSTQQKEAAAKKQAPQQTQTKAQPQKQQTR